MQHSPIPLDRFFFALRPPGHEARRIAAFADRLGQGVRTIRPDHLHVTLAITDDFTDYPYALVKSLRKVGDRVAAEPFDVKFDQLSGSTRSLALRPQHGIPELKRLQQTVADRMREAGAPMRKDWRYSPHVTLFYRNGSPFVRPVPEFGWRAQELFLIRSHVGRTHHDVVDHWVLRPEEQSQFNLF
jgi:2'-5' RNA ligase